MGGHFICEYCGYDGDCADYCRRRRPVSEQWKGNYSKAEMEKLKNTPAPQLRKLE